MSDDCLPEGLKGKRHDDWRWYVSWVKRSWTARCGKNWPVPPKLLLGNSGWNEADAYRFGHFNDPRHKNHYNVSGAEEFLKKYGSVMPIPKAANWMDRGWLPLPMFAWKFANEHYISLGLARWDEVDFYYDLLRVRASGWKGRVAMAVTGGLLALIIWLVFW
ncbi:MAG: hypothetical protein ACE5FB_00235 [Candidatus Binatia bacterium]